MKYQSFISIIVISFTFFAGMLVGIVYDKDWLSEQQLAYIERLKAENHLLHFERESWLSFVAEEMSPYDIFVSTEADHYPHLTSLLSRIGLEAKRLEHLDKVIESKQGILITLGQEVEQNQHLLHLSLDKIPEKEDDVQQFYLSLLKVKGEKMNAK